MSSNSSEIYKNLQNQYNQRHTSGNLFSLETLIFNKLIKCELMNRPIQLRSKLDYSLFIEVDPINREYKYFTMNRKVQLSSKTIDDKNTSRISLRKKYESLYNKDFEYYKDERISAPSRIFIANLPKKNFKEEYQISDIKLIISESFKNISNNSKLLKKWNTIVSSIYEWKYPIDSYYRLGKFDRHEDVFIDEYLKNINSLGEEYKTASDRNVMFSNNLLYCYKDNRKMNFILFDRIRELYNAKSWFRRLHVNQLLLTNHQFYKLNFPYDYCYVNIIKQLNSNENHKLQRTFIVEEFVKEKYFLYEHDIGEFIHFFSNTINKLFKNNNNISLLTSSDDDNEEDNQNVIYKLNNKNNSINEISIEDDEEDEDEDDDNFFLGKSLLNIESNIRDNIFDDNNSESSNSSDTIVDSPNSDIIIDNPTNDNDNSIESIDIPWIKMKRRKLF